MLYSNQLVLCTAVCKYNTVLDVCWNHHAPIIFSLMSDPAKYLARPLDHGTRIMRNIFGLTYRLIWRKYTHDGSTFWVVWWAKLQVYQFPPGSQTRMIFSYKARGDYMHITLASRISDPGSRVRDWFPILQPWVAPKVIYWPGTWDCITSARIWREHRSS